MPPAASLAVAGMVEWVRLHGASVSAHDEIDLDLVQANHIGVNQVVYRCGPDTAAIRRAVGIGVSRFIVGTGHQIARVAQCADTTKYLYLEDRAPLVVGDGRLKVIGFHTDVDEAEGDAGWSAAARRLVDRSAVLNACGTQTKRLILSGVATRTWFDVEAAAVMAMVTKAMSDECGRLRLPEPAITLAVS